MKRYFKFYVAYYELIDSVSVFQLKKLLKALCEYSEYGFLTVSLNRKTRAVYDRIIEVMRVERLHYQKLGEAGRKKRSRNSAKNGGNSAEIQRKHGGKVKVSRSAFEGGNQDEMVQA